MKLPTGELSQRLLQNGGRVPYGLFRPNVHRALRSIGDPPTDPIAILVARLREMLRDLTNINVRQPSHMAPTFRSIPFFFQERYTTTVGEQTVAVPINGNLLVPPGTNAVLNFVQVEAVPELGLVGNTPIEPWADPNRIVSLRVNSNGAPGFDGIRPSFTGTYTLGDGVGGQFFGVQGRVERMPLAPLLLKQGDALSFAYNNPTTGQHEFLLYVQLAGYLYPVENEEDGLRGTLADRG